MGIEKGTLINATARDRLWRYSLVSPFILHQQGKGKPFDFAEGHGAQGHNPDLIANNWMAHNNYLNYLFTQFGGIPGSPRAARVAGIKMVAAGFAPPPQGLVHCHS